jgi:hypothetical protein
MFGELIKEPLCNVTDVQMGSVSSRFAEGPLNDEGDGSLFYIFRQKLINWIKIGDVSPNALYITKTDSEDYIRRRRKITSGT